MSSGTLALQAGSIFGGEGLGSLGGYLRLWPAAPTPNPVLPAAAGITTYLTPAAAGPVTTTASFPTRPTYDLNRQRFQS